MQGKQLLIWIWNYEKEHKRQRKGEKELLGRGKRMVQKAWKDLKKFSLAEAWKLSLKIEHDELFITWQRSWTLVCRQWAANTHGHILNLLFFFSFFKDNWQWCHELSAEWAMRRTNQGQEVGTEAISVANNLIQKPLDRKQKSHPPLLR